LADLIVLAGMLAVENQRKWPGSPSEVPFHWTHGCSEKQTDAEAFEGN